MIGDTLPHGARVQGARLDGERVYFRLHATNRGVQVLVRVPARGAHKLVARSR